MNGAQWVVHALRTQGVDTVFGYPGGAIMPVYDALYDGGVEHLLCRHEQGAAMAAIGYARATGKTGVCIATSGPGATNLITGLADALLDSIPIVAITGQVAAPFIGTDAFQEVDVLGLSLACTKHSFLVQSLDELPRVIAEAFQVANSGRPGPVLVDIPKDIQMAQGDLDPHFSMVADEMTFPQAEVAQALQMLAQSQQPMLYVGGGVGMAQAVPALREFLAVTRMPATCTLKGLGVVDADYPYYLGMLGMHGTKAANLAVQECDLLIAVGVIVAESIGRMLHPEPVVGGAIAWTAGVGVAINGFTAWLFMKDKDRDLNVKGAYLHMAADALVSVGVLVSGLVISWTGWTVVDPIVGLAVAGVIVASVWSLTRDSLRLSLDGVPGGIDIAEIERKMEAVPGVRAVHHIHVWAISTTENALTAHVVLDSLSRMEEVKHALKELLGRSEIPHATLEFESVTERCCDLHD